MKTIAFTAEVLMRLAVFVALLGAVFHRTRMDKRAARATTKNPSRSSS